jgi:rifampin ADP-ribosylating transferase
MQIELIEAYDRIEDVKTLFGEYAASLPVDLSYQNYEEELALLPGKYARPNGRLYLAFVEGELAGCAALRRLDTTRAEMKRLYVRNSFRGLRLGRMLVERLIADAKEIGCRYLVLDTLSSMARAQQLYRELGFVEISPYYDCPIPGTVFLSLSLENGAAISSPPDPGPFYHGTKADLHTGDLLEPRHSSNYGSRKAANFVYMSATLDAAIWGAELAKGDSPGRIYQVAPTGAFENDPNLTDKKFPGNPTRSYRTHFPLRVIGEVTNWSGHPPDVLQAMLDHLAEPERQGVEAIND